MVQTKAFALPVCDRTGNKLELSMKRIDIIRSMV